MIARLCYVVCDEPSCLARAATESYRATPTRNGSESRARYVAEMYSGFLCGDEIGDWCEDHRPT